MAEQYRENPWENQRHRIEVWVEKAALLGVIEGICTRYRVPYFASIGNNSQSEQYKAGKRLENYLDDGLCPVILHLADHDPNGIDMTRDNRDRLTMFASREIEVRRIALNMDQVRQYRPPPNPAKETDSRFTAYVENYGTEQSWELDALSPTVIADLIQHELAALIDPVAWKKSLTKERRNLALLSKVTANWSKVENLVRGGVAP